MNEFLPPYLRGEIPAFLEEAFRLKALLRLKGVGMHCGLEYASFPYFSKVLPYNRYGHSLGAAFLAYRFSHEKKVAIATAFHDVATPCFAHVVDFLRGDHESQEATEEPTSKILREDPEILNYLKGQDLSVEEVEDYHKYAIADNDAPRLSCDRLEYTLSNFLNFHILEEEEVVAILEDLVVGVNEEGEEEIMFKHLEKARQFGIASLENSRMYTRDEDRYAMEALARALKETIEAGDLDESDLMGTEKELIGKWLSSSSADRFKDYRALSFVSRFPLEGKEALFSAIIPTKKRYIDPYILGRGRLSENCSMFARGLEDLKAASFEAALYGYALPND